MSKRKLETLQRRKDYLRKTANNHSAKEELAAISWAIEKLTLMASPEDERRSTNNGTQP